MDIWTIHIDLATLERINLIVGKENAVAVFDRSEVDPQRTRNGKRFIPGLDFFVPVLVDVGSLLYEGRGLVPGLGVFLLHCLD